MTRVDFYLLQQQQALERDQFACRLVNQLYRQGRNIYLHCADEATAGAMDELLWGYAPQAFLPHGLLGGADDERIAIGWKDDPGHHRDVMINLALSVPEFVGRFERVAEVVVQTPEIRDPLRESWKYYKSRGYPLHNNKIQAP